MAESSSSQSTRRTASARRATSDALQIDDWEKDIPGSFAHDRKTYLFPIINGQTVHGRTTEWLMTVRFYASLDDAQADKKQISVSPAIARNEDLATCGVARLLIYYRVLDDNNADKEVQSRAPTFITEGKNIGRANETNVFCQALRAAYSLYNKQLRNVGGLTTVAAAASDDYVSRIEDRDAELLSPVTPLPMLAKPYDDVYGADDSPSPLYIQRKYNGVRAIGTIINNSPVLYSRKGLMYSGFDRVKHEIRAICSAWHERALVTAHDHGIRQSGELYLDGELYCHGMSLQKISGIVRRVRNAAVQDTLQYVVYDVFVLNKGSTECNNLTFDDRYAIIRAIGESPISRELQKIVFAETTVCINGSTRAIDRAKVLYRGYLEEGYEGAIVRLNAAYRHSACNFHSSVLLKLKPTRDAEYEIVGYTAGAKGKAAGALLFICQTPDGKRFNITPTGSLDGRIARVAEFAQTEENGRTVFENHWLGRPLIVFFDEVSEDGVPQRARTDGTIRTCD